MVITTYNDQNDCDYKRIIITRTWTFQIRISPATVQNFIQCNTDLSSELKIPVTPALLLKTFGIYWHLMVAEMEMLANPYSCFCCIDKHFPVGQIHI